MLDLHFIPSISDNDRFMKLFLESPELFAACLFTSIAAVTDLRSRKIPNWLTLSCLIFGVVFHSFQIPKFGVLTFLASLEGGLLALLILAGLWLAKGAGAGDAKLGAALGVWLSTQEILYILMASLFLCLIWRIIEKQLGKGEGQQANTNSSPFQIPFAVPLLIVLLGLALFRLNGASFSVMP